MTYELDAAGVERLEAYFEGIGGRLGGRAGPRVRSATRSPRDGIARANQRVGDRRHGFHEAGTRVARRAAAVHGVGRKGRQLPDRRESDTLHADRARAGGYAAVPAGVVAPG